MPGRSRSTGSGGSTGAFRQRIHGERWTPLPATIEGWVESLALAHHASNCAKQITKAVGHDVEQLPLDGYEPVGR